MSIPFTDLKYLEEFEVSPSIIFNSRKKEPLNFGKVFPKL
jgi:hypothetical protein